MQKTQNFFTMGMQNIKDFGEWMLNYIPPKPKLVDKVLESFKNKIEQMYERVIACSNQLNANLL